MWEPFTETVRKIMVIANEEANTLGSGEINAEHILMGILGFPESNAVKIIRNLGADPGDIRAEMDNLIPVEEKSGQKQNNFSRGAKRCIELAFEEARFLSVNYVGTEHLLLAVIKLGEGIAAHVLSHRGLILAKARDEAKKMLLHPKEGAETQDSRISDDTSTDLSESETSLFTVRNGDDEEKGENEPEKLTVSIYSENIRKVFVNARREAHRRDSKFVEPEDLLAGILAIPDCSASRILAGRGYAPGEPPEDSEEYLLKWNEAISETVVFSNKSREVSKLAFEEFNNSSVKHMGTEHLLLGLIIEGAGETFAGRILTDSERVILNLEEIREEVKKLTMPIFTDEKKQYYDSSGQKMEMKSPPAVKVDVEPEVLAEKDSETAGTGEDFPAHIHPLETYCTNLTEKALSDDWEPVSGWQYEIDRIIQILSRYSRNNPLLISPSQTSVRAVLKGLAQRIVSGDVPEFLQDKRLLSLDMEEMLVSNPSRDLLEEQMRRILNDLRFSGGILLFIPDIYHIFGSGGVNSAIYLPLVMKSMLSCGNIQCICSTDSHNYRDYIRHDPVLDRCFFPIEMEEADVNETMEILKSFRPVLEKHYNAVLGDETLLHAARLADRYIKEGILPEKAIDLIEETASRMFGPNMKSQGIHRDMAKLDKLLEETKEKKVHVKAAMESFIADNLDNDKSDYFAEKIKFFSGRMLQLEEEEKDFQIKRSEMKKDLERQESEEKGVVRDISFGDIMETAGIKFDVLLCNYSGDNKSLNEIRSVLEEKGIKTWTGECFVPPGRCRREEIETVFPLVKTMAVLLGNEKKSEDENAKTGEKAETEELIKKFLDSGKPVIPIILSNIECSPEIPHILKGMKPANFRKETPDPWEDLLWGIRGKRE